MLFILPLLRFLIGKLSICKMILARHNGQSPLKDKREHFVTFGYRKRGSQNGHLARNNEASSKNRHPGNSGHRTSQ